MLPGLIFLVALPALVFGTYRLVLASRRVASYRPEPRLHRTIVLGSVALGLGIVLSDPGIRANLLPGRLVDETGIWALDWHAFLVERGDPVGHITRFLGREAAMGGLATVLLALGFALAGTAFVLVCTSFPRQDAVISAFLSICVVIVIGSLTIYLTMLAAYMIHVLNFWSFILWIVIIQYFRNEKHSEKVIPHG